MAATTPKLHCIVDLGFISGSRGSARIERLRARAGQIPCALKPSQYFPLRKQFRAVDAGPAPSCSAVYTCAERFRWLVVKTRPPIPCALVCLATSRYRRDMEQAQRKRTPSSEAAGCTTFPNKAVAAIFHGFRIQATPLQDKRRGILFLNGIRTTFIIAVSQASWTA